MRSSAFLLRRALPAVCLALGLATGAARSRAQEAELADANSAPAESPEPAHRVAVAAGVVPPAFEPARAALAERVRLRLGDARVAVLESATAAAAGAASCTRAAKLAPADASELVMVDL